MNGFDVASYFDDELLGLLSMALGDKFSPSALESALYEQGDG
jgi:hypothetical protein